MLTKTAIDRTRTRTSPFVLWDDELGGFGCKVHPTGRRSFVVQYRLRGSRKLHQITLGEYGALTVAQARKGAANLLAQVRLGGDPLAARKAKTAEVEAAAKVLTVTGLVEQYLIALKAGQANSKRMRGRAAAPAYTEDTELQLRRFADRYGNEPAGEITRGHLLRLLDGYVRQPSVHRRLRGAIHRMYAWARARDLVNNAPADDIEASSPPSRERVLSLAELARIWKAADGLPPLYGDAVKLLITTGQRRNEVAGMTWGELDLSGTTWTLPTERTKARRRHVLPLPPLAVEVLMRRRAGYRNAPWPADLVLPTDTRSHFHIAPISGWNWLKRELDKASGVTDWRLHDFRRSLVSICAEHGAEVATLDSMLNHASSATRGGVIGTYQRATLLEPMRRAMQLWSRLLRDALDENATPVNEKMVALASR